MKKSDFFDTSIIRFILTIIAFIGLEIWELLKFIWKFTGGAIIKYWNKFLIGVGSLILIVIWSYFIIWQTQYFNVYNGIVFLLNLIVMGILIGIGYLIYLEGNKIRIFFAENWKEAKQIVNKRIL